MKVYVHKHLAFEADFWSKIEDYMQSTKNTNFTELVRDSLIEKIKISLD